MEYGGDVIAKGAPGRRAWGASLNVSILVGASPLGAHSRRGRHPDIPRDRSPGSGPAFGRRQIGRAHV